MKLNLNSILLGIFIGILLGVFLMNKLSTTITQLPKVTHHETYKYDTIYPEAKIVEMPKPNPKDAALRNPHGVPEKTIIKMLKNFEKYKR